MIKKHPFIFGFAGLLIYTVIDDHIRYTKFCKEHSQWEKERAKRLKAMPMQWQAYNQVQKEIKGFK
jgi:ribosomal protein L44E